MQTSFPEPKYFICSLTLQAARKMIAHYNRVLIPLGITAQQMLALGVLWREENISLGVFARRSGTGKAAAVTMINRLEQMGLVRRQLHPEDARLNKLTLTGKARELAPKIAEKVANLENTLEKTVGNANMQTLSEGLMAIRDLDL
jgi:MarR family transcriptional regulator, organic hydroperoxide resistance regulator